MQLEQTVIVAPLVLPIKAMEKEVEIKMTVSLDNDPRDGIVLELIFLLLKATESKLFGTLHRSNDYQSIGNRKQDVPFYNTAAERQDLKFILKMFNKEEVRKQLIQYYRAVGSGENIVQCIKQALFLHEKFNPVMLFEVLSKGKQRMTREDWRAYLVKRSISFSEDELRYFCNHNNFGSEITLNEFLESMIPYNADVVREFKAKYLDSLQVREFDPEVQFIFAELMSNWVKFIRSLIKIRTEMSDVVTRKQIEQLIKEDLVLRSKPRQARKFHEGFQARDFQLTFHQLRKFLQLWISSKEIIHEFYLLNVKRHIKCQNPFQKIVFKSGGKSKSKSTTKQRAISTQKLGKTQGNFAKIRQENLEQQKYDGEGTRNYGTDTKRGGNKYEQFKRQILEDYVKEKHGLSPDNSRSQRSRSRPTDQKYRESPPNQQLRRSRYDRESKNIDGTLIVKIFEEIVLKEERLEKLRKKLSKMPDFNLINLFKLIDYDNKGYVSSKSLSDFTGDTSVQYNHLIGFHAREKDRLRFQQFCVFFRPLSKQLNDALDKRPEHKVPNPFKRETQKLILEILHLTAEMHCNIFRTKERINRDGIDPMTLFSYVDLDDKGFIEAECVRVVLQEHNVNCESKDMKCLMKLFRKKVDERIKPKEFINFIDL